MRNVRGFERAGCGVNLAEELGAAIGSECDGDGRIAERMGAELCVAQAAKGAMVTPDSLSRAFNARRIETASALSP